MPLPGPAARGPGPFAGLVVGLLWFSRLTPFIASVSRILAMSFLKPPYACRLFAIFQKNYCRVIVISQIFLNTECSRSI